MGILHIDELEVGLELAEDVTSPQGMKIAGPGDTITEKHLKAFKAWGVTEVKVKGAEAHEPQNTAKEATLTISEHEIMQELDCIFGKTDRSNPVIAELYDLALKQAQSKDDLF